MLALLGHKIDRLKVPFIPAVDDSEACRQRTLVARWGRFATANAKFVFPVMLVVILGLAATSALVRLGAADQGTQPTKQTSAPALRPAGRGLRGGLQRPIPIVVDVNNDPQAPQRIYDDVHGLEGVASVDEPQLNDEKTVGIIFVKPASAPQDEGDRHARRPAARRRRPEATSGGNAVAYVSGQTAAFKDIADQMMA